MLGRIKDAIFGGVSPVAPSRAPARRQSPPRQSFDAAKTTADNANHWAAADGLGPNAAASYDVRAKLRNRSRYERENNPYIGGLIEYRAAETIGTGPRLQLSLPTSWIDPDFQREVEADPNRVPDPAREIELRWLEWSERIDLADKLILIDETETTDGEVFVVAITNPVLSLDGMGPTLDVKLFEADQCYNPNAAWADRFQQDGIEFDRYGNPIAYHFLNTHPGETNWGMDYTSERILADRVFHFFKRRRPSAAHGIPGLTASLPLGSRMRRYTEATVAAAEIQALIAAVLTNEHTGAAGEESNPEPEAMDTINFARAQLLTLFAGQDVKTLTPSQPIPSYKEFKGEILTECGRSIGAPRNVSTGSSAEYNYSSGRLDQQGFQRTIKIRRDRIRRIILDRLFRIWLEEASLVPGYLPADLPPVKAWKWSWRWDGFASIDPLKDANAAKVRLESGLSTMERECGETGEDWEEVLEQQAREQKRKQGLGIVATAKPNPMQDPAPIDEEDTANVV